MVDANCLWGPLAGAFAIGAQVVAILGSSWHPALELANHFVKHGSLLGCFTNVGW